MSGPALPMKLHVGDCIPFMASLPANRVHLGFADPPFNIGWKYDEYEDAVPTPQYREWTGRWLAGLERIVMPGGALWVAINDRNVAHVATAAEGLGLTLRNWCVWRYRFGTYQHRRFATGKTHLLYFLKGPKPLRWNPEPILVESERQRIGDKRANPKGRLPDDVWDFPRVCGNYRERTRHPAQMPVAVLERIVLACSDPGDVVFDAFAGSGTSGEAARKTGRAWVGAETSEGYAAAIRERLGLTA